MRISSLKTTLYPTAVTHLIFSRFTYNIIAQRQISVITGNVTPSEMARVLEYEVVFDLESIKLTTNKRIHFNYSDPSFKQVVLESQCYNERL